MGILDSLLDRSIVFSFDRTGYMRHARLYDPADLDRSLPRFWRIMRHRLRTPAEGADTALWLAVAERLQGETAKFWFDRRAVPTHLFPWTREGVDERRRLWDFCEASTGSARNPKR